VLRRLAGEVAEVAAEPIQQERIGGWKRVNALADHRPMLWINEIPWGEFEDSVEELRCVCADEPCRRIERSLRRRLFTARRLSTDEVVHGRFYVPKAITGLNFGIDISERQLDQGTTHIRSHYYDSVLADFDDLEKIRQGPIEHDEDETARRAERAEGLFGDLLPVEVHGLRKTFFNGWDQVVRWTGPTQALMDLAARPDFVHAIMRRTTDAYLDRLDQLEAKGLLDHPHPIARVGSGAAGYVDELPRPGHEAGPYTAMDQWGGATAQIFSEVSPAMHEEFALRYEIETMARCGLNYYGCCEPLHNKMHLLEQVPRLRKISISAWCDVTAAAEAAGRRYVFSHKPSPAALAENVYSDARAEADLRDRLDKSHRRGIPCEVIMKDISTVRADPQRLIDWTAMAARVVREYA
jgi:hypothetical protein